MKRVVITGATGAIGSALVGKLIEENIEIYILCRKNSSRRSVLPNHFLIHMIECNLDELKDLDTSCLKKCDVFYHLGWEATIGADRNNTSLQVKNIQYTLDAVRLAHKLGCHTFIGAGSQAEYGRYEGKLNAKVPTFPENGYGIAKLCAGQMSRLLCNELGMKHIWTRILSVYGPNDTPMSMVSTAIRKMLDGESSSFTKGEQQWDYLFSKDAANALFLLGDKGVPGKIYCIGSGKTRPLAEYIQIIQKATSTDARVEIGALPYSEKQVMHLCADITELEKDTGFCVQYEFEEGILETIKWMKGKKDNAEN